MKEVLDDKFEPESIGENEVIPLDFYFKGEFDFEDENRVRKVLLKPRVDGFKRSIIAFLLLAFIVGGVGYARLGEDPSAYVALGVGIAFLIIICWTIINAIQSRRLSIDFFKSIDKEYAEHMTYEFYINDVYFGQKDFIVENRFNWTKNIHVKRMSDILFFYPWEKSSDPIFFISKNAIGKVEFEELVAGIQNKIAHLKSSK
ncbi:MAG: hypothetical protein ACI8ZM_005091 [Crocinitomix sp.]|jgi:hypothetical protein